MISVRPLALTISLAGCVAVTINVTFPQEQIDSAASNIEELVRTPAAPPAAPATPGQGERARLTPAAANAREPELKTRTPEIMKVIESRRARYSRVAAALATGCLGENNRGLLEPRPGTQCPPDIAVLTADENRDRMQLYRTLLEQNRMRPADLVRVQAGFARANREQAPSGAWVQDDAGRWSRK
jgi:hypothetical protein